ncbi:tubulin-like doman-containing protein [Candidatus Venteria ishoeyi]|uniref:Tubulin-like protein n=1 Tax=Candidatus Venteria ishoeyi TaxID=1899563 RepID=A0A1H6F8M8_9GAMM|nr:tubulin-like doman-containing protein [Candidatus Venteria ishoeyi]SEH05751.1 Uncharacterised protein [Candidatus Venteria ishoeyi]
MAVHALVLGFGGTGAHILTYLKEISVLKQGGKPEGIKFLLFDTLANWKPGETVQIMGGAGEEKVAEGHEKGTSLEPATEYYYLKDDHPPLEHYAYQLLAPGSGNTKQYSHLKDWLHTAWLSRHIAKDKLNITDGAAQQRQIGRFAMFQNIRPIVSYIESALRELKSQAGDATVQVWIVGSSAGGTGAGSMLDAAFMARLAASRVGGSIQVSGTIVLPDIYGDKPGISNARTYALFRELDRFQEVGFGNSNDHRYFINGKQTASQVWYDHTGQQRALVEGRLFDNLFYLGIPCNGDSEREAFFSSVANAMDPYLDDNQGPRLLEHSVNNVGFAASSFGAARLYVPQETLAELFAWQEAEAFVTAITAPKMEGKVPKDLYSGSQADRQEQAKERAKNLLPLFEELLKLEGKTLEQQAGFAKNLDPKTIVTEWYQLGGAGIIGIKVNAAEIQKTKLAYVNPYLSLIEADEDKIDKSDILVKTFKENKDTKGSKEDQKASRERFASELEQQTKDFTKDGKNTFEEGRKLVFNIASSMISKKIDTLIEEELNRNKAISWDDSAQNNGTTMTRLYQEIIWAGADNGPLDNISKIITIFLEGLDQEENIRSQQAVNASNTLRDAAPSFFGTWVEEPQEMAREECENYIRWYQKRRLLKDMQELVEQAKKRFHQWAATFHDHVVSELTISQSDRQSALEIINDNITRLEGRMYRLARNRTALISCDPAGGDTSLQGYSEELRRHAAGEGENRLANQLLSQCEWKLSYGKHGMPTMELSTPLPKPNPLRNIYQTLHDYFRDEINVELRKRDIFDYLLYLREFKNVDPEQIVRILNDTSNVLLRTQATVASAQWIYKDPDDKAKKDFTATLQTALTQVGTNTEVKDAERLYSDRNSLTLMKIAKPAPFDVSNLYGPGGCKDDYIREQNDVENNDYNHDQTLFRAQVYHTFRPELEAWFIERYHAHRTGEYIGPETEVNTVHISPRLSRLLEHPDMMQAFIRCIATGAVEKDERRIWVFHNTVKKKDIDLTTREEPKADITRAAVIFVLRQQEGRHAGMQKIFLEDAMQSAIDAAQQKEIDANADEVVEAFVGKPENTECLPVDDFLDKHFQGTGLNSAIADQEKKNLKMLFQFYGDRDRRTQLADRMELPQ